MCRARGGRRRSRHAVPDISPGNRPPRVGGASSLLRLPGRAVHVRMRLLPSARSAWAQASATGAVPEQMRSGASVATSTTWPSSTPCGPPHPGGRWLSSARSRGYHRLIRDPPCNRTAVRQRGCGRLENVRGASARAWRCSTHPVPHHHGGSRLPTDARGSVSSTGWTNASARTWGGSARSRDGVRGRLATAPPPIRTALKGGRLAVVTRR